MFFLTTTADAACNLNGRIVIVSHHMLMMLISGHVAHRDVGRIVREEVLARDRLCKVHGRYFAFLCLDHGVYDVA